MKINHYLLVLAVVLALPACEREGHDDCQPSPVTPVVPAPVVPPLTVTNGVLLVKVDYLTNTFEGGTELTFPTATPTFTISQLYDEPGDFGNLRLTYQELNEPLFDGSIIWMGCGQMRFPQALTPAAQFDTVATNGVVTPSAGFDNIFSLGGLPPNGYAFVWGAVQKLTKVRQYLNAHPNAKVKLFLYTPSVGVGDPADWDWFFILNS